MLQISLLLLFNSLYCLGFYLSAQDGMLLSFVTKYGSRLGWYFNPIAGCVTCMASLHSWPFIYVFGLDWLYLPYICALACLNTVLFNKYLE